MRPRNGNRCRAFTSEQSGRRDLNAEYKSFEWIAQAMAGAMSMTGAPDGPPTKAIGGLADTGAGLHTAIGCHRRSRQTLPCERGARR